MKKETTSDTAMTNRRKYAKTPLEEVLEAYLREYGHGEADESFSIWLGQPAKEDPRQQPDEPSSPGASEGPKRQANPLPDALAGLLAAGLAGKNGEPPHVNVWVLVNGRLA